MILKNVAGQKIAVLAYDTANSVKKTGDAANITAEISLDGGTSAATNDANPTELEATDHPGIYIFDLTQAETNADMVIISPVSATSDITIEPIIIYTHVLPLTAAEVNAEVDQALLDYDAPTKAELDAAQTAIQNDIAALPTAAEIRAEIDSNSTQLALILADTNELQIDWANGGRLDLLIDAILADTNELQSDDYPTLIAALPTAAENADQVWDEARAGHVTAGTFGEGVKAESLNTQAKADVNAEADTALSDYDPPTKAELDTAESNIRGVDSDTLKTLSDQIDGISASSIADAVWDEAKAGHVAAGSFGEEVQGHALSTEIDALNDLSAAQVNAEVDTALGDYDAPTKAEMDTAFDAVPTAIENADALLTRDIDNVEGSAPVHSLTGAALKLVSKFLNGITYKTNGTDTFMTQTLESDADAEPTIGISSAS